MRFFLIAQWNLRNVEEYKKLEAKNLMNFQEFWRNSKNVPGILTLRCFG
jgi:hypothetical protein